MCRIILYIAKDDGIELDYIVTQANNSMIRLANGEPHLPGVKYFKHIYDRNPWENLDGYGIYFIDFEDNLYCKKSKFPILDIEKNKLHKRVYPYLSKKVQYICAFVRNNNFKHVIPNKFQDVQPYKYKQFLFVHNGGFNTQYSKYTNKLSEYIDPKFLKRMQKINVDSKWLFGLFISIVNFTGTIDEIIKSLEDVLYIMHKIKDMTFNISLNVVISDLSNDTHIAIRYRTCKQLPPAMYYNKIHPKGYFVSSEPLDDEPGWKLMHNNLIVIRGKSEFHSRKLNPKMINCLI